MNRAIRKSTSMTIRRDLIEEARDLGINISQAAEGGVIAAIRSERGRRWREDNQAAISDYNDYVDAGGVPLAEYRKF